MTLGIWFEIAVMAMLFAISYNVNRIYHLLRNRDGK